MGSSRGFEADNPTLAINRKGITSDWNRKEQRSTKCKGWISGRRPRVHSHRFGNDEYMAEHRMQRGLATSALIGRDDV